VLAVRREVLVGGQDMLTVLLEEQKSCLPVPAVPERVLPVLQEESPGEQSSSSAMRVLAEEQKGPSVLQEMLASGRGDSPAMQEVLSSGQDRISVLQDGGSRAEHAESLPAASYADLRLMIQALQEAQKIQQLEKEEMQRTCQLEKEKAQRAKQELREMQKTHQLEKEKAQRAEQELRKVQEIHQLKVEEMQRALLEVTAIKQRLPAAEQDAEEVPKLEGISVRVEDVSRDMEQGARKSMPLDLKGGSGGLSQWLFDEGG
jgi:hypothetical protein